MKKFNLILFVFVLIISVNFVLADSYTDCIDIADSTNITCYNDSLANETNICDTDYLGNIESCEENYEPEITLSAPDEELGEKTTLSIEIEGGMELDHLLIDWDDSTDKTYIKLGGEESENESEHEYDAKGTYDIEVEVFMKNGNTYLKSIDTEIEEPEIIDEKPEVTLLGPKANEIIKVDKVTFSFEVDDDFAIDNCEYGLWIQLGNGFQELDYSQTIDNIQIGKNVDLQLIDFEDGNYSWYVTCEDNSTLGQTHTQSRDFQIKTVTHPRQREIEGLLEELDAFLQKQESMSLEEIEAMEEVGLTENLKYYRKRLIQINQDLGNNLKFISNPDLREIRERETHEELDDIKLKLPLGFTLVDSKEYIKNSLTQTLSQITKEYVDAKKIDLSEKKINALAKLNHQIQNKISTSSELKQLEIKYSTKIEKITIVKKKIKVSDSNFNKILEYIPNKIDNEIEFKTKVKKLTSTIYEIDTDDLEEGELIYYVKEEVSINDLTDTDSVLFEEFPINSLGGITGYFVLDMENPKNSSITIIILATIIALIYFGTKYSHLFFMRGWKKEGNVLETLNQINKSKEALKQEDIEIAKENYHKIKEVFGLLPKGFRKYIYPEIKKIRIGIDKREMNLFIEEYENAKRDKRDEDIKRIYKNIKAKYSLLPQKYQEKVYKKIIKKTL